MKKLFYLLLAYAALQFSTYTFGQGWGGAGTSGDPWLIPNDTALDSIRYNIDGSEYYYLQTADIDLSSWGEWDAIGTAGAGNAFEGGYDGGGYTITGLTRTTAPTEVSNDLHAGLFGRVDGTIAPLYLKHIHLVDIEIRGAWGSGASDQSYHGALAGYVLEQGAATYYIDSCTVLGINIQTTTSREHFSGGLFGKLENSINARRCAVTGVEQDSITMLQNSSNQPRMGGFVGLTTSGVVISESYVRDIYTRTNRLGGYNGGFVGSMAGGAFANCFVLDVEIVDSLTSSSAFALSGPFFGNKSGSINKCYAVGTMEYLSYTDSVGFGGQLNASTGDNNFYDRDIAGTDDDFGSTTGGSCTVYDQSTDSMKIESTFTWRGWDFDSDTLWNIDGSNFDGYPFFAWFAQDSGPILNYPTEAGLEFREDSVITIHWTAPTDTAIDNIFIYFSTNSGTDWVVQDTVVVADTSVSWTVPRYSITTAKIKVQGDAPTYWADSSANDFAINPFSDIEIYDVSPTTATFTQAGGVDSISVRSQYVEEFDLFWSNDSLIWNIIELTISVDTVNSALWDSTLYVWSIGPTTISGGPTIWIKAEESRDTSSVQDLVDEGVGLNKLGNLFCMNVTGTYLVSDCASGTINLDPVDGIVNALTYYDNSCGWSNVTHRLYWHEIAVTDTNTWLISYNNQYNPLTFDRRQCTTTELIEYPSGSQWQINILNSAGDDSTVITRAGAVSADDDSILYNGWWYSFLTDGTNYYVMGRATNTAVYDTIMDYTDRTGITSTSMSQSQADHRLAILHFPIDVVAARADSNDHPRYYVTSDLTTMKDYADSLGFTAKIMVGDEGRQQSMYYVTTWEPAPDNNNLAEDIYSSTLSITMGRYYFRGIDPKIAK